MAIARRRELDSGDDLALARISRERDRAALRFAKDRDLGQLEATMARLDAEAQAAVVRPSRIPTAAEARAYLESLPDLWAKTSDAGRKAIAEAVFERIDVLGATDYTFTLTAHAKARGWDAAFGAGVAAVKEGRSGRGESVRVHAAYASGDASQMSRDMRDSRAHVEASGGLSSRSSPSSCRSPPPQPRVQDQPATAHASGPPLSRRWAGRARASLPPTADPAQGRTPTPIRARIVACAPSSPPGSWRGAGRHRLAPRPRGPAGPVDLTVRRVLHAAGLVDAGAAQSARAARGTASRPRRPTSAGSGFAHWRLADGSEVEICAWLDDHSRYLLACAASGGSAATTWWPRSARPATPHGWPPPRSPTARSTPPVRRRSHRFRVPVRLPRRPAETGHRATPAQGKIERFHQTLKRWLGQRRRHGRGAGLQASSTPSATPTTSCGRTGRPGVHPQGEAYRATPGPHMPSVAAHPATSACATTSPTAEGRDDPATGRSPLSPQGRGHLRPTTRPGYRR